MLPHTEIVHSNFRFMGSLILSFTLHSHLHVLVILQQLKQAGPPHAAASSDQQQELMRVRAELEKKSVQYEEDMCRRETLHGSEMKNLQKELRDAEGQHLTHQKEILMLKDKLEKTRREMYVCVAIHEQIFV